VVCVLVASLSACSESAPSQPAPPNPVTGLIVFLEDGELTLRVDEEADQEEQEYVFTIADPTVPVKHLREHQRDRLPVRVSWQQEDDRLLATSIADA
jgi:hypothetical protein